MCLSIWKAIGTCNCRNMKKMQRYIFIQINYYHGKTENVARFKF